MVARNDTHLKVQLQLIGKVKPRVGITLGNALNTFALATWFLLPGTLGFQRLY